MTDYSVINMSFMYIRMVDDFSNKLDYGISGSKQAKAMAQFYVLENRIIEE